MKNLYKNDFEKFLSHTNEKKVLLKEIVKIMAKYNVKSVLDIGAGNGLLSIPLSKKTDDYLAIEPNKNFAAKLKNSGLNVINKKFPLKISSLFDMVLASHSMPYSENLFKLFIKESWKLIKNGGIFVTIIYKGQKDDWVKLMKKIGKNQEKENKDVFNKIMKFLSSIGRIKKYKIITEVKTKNINDMIQALSFVASDGKLKEKNEFLKQQGKLKYILMKNYDRKNGYYFPFQHFILITQKTANLKKLNKIKLKK